MAALGRRESPGRPEGSQRPRINASALRPTQASGSTASIEAEGDSPLPATLRLNRSDFAIVGRLGKGREGTVFLAERSDAQASGEIVVIKQFHSPDDMRKNFVALKRLERFLASPKIAPHSVVKVLDNDSERRLLLLEHANGIPGDSLYDHQSGAQAEHEESARFAEAFRALHTFVEETPQLRWGMASKNVVWQPESQKIVIFDPF
jgi:predicted Ser/Thr protein kinase